MKKLLLSLLVAFGITAAGLQSATAADLSTADQSSTADNVIQLTGIGGTDLQVSPTQSLDSYLVGAAFTGIGNGVLAGFFTINGINSDSRVFASICELRSPTDPKSTFLGACKMRVLDIAPNKANNGVWIRVEIPWSSPLHFRINVLADSRPLVWH